MVRCEECGGPLEEEAASVICDGCRPSPEEVREESVWITMTAEARKSRNKRNTR